MFQQLKKHLSALVMLASSLSADSSQSEQLVHPKLITQDKSLSPKEAESMIQAARAFYTFWDTGDPKFATLALDPNFIDQTLPEGRPQGPSGPLFASSNFRKAVPDLSCTVEELLVVGDKVVARLTFTGHHGGEFQGKAPTGKPISFRATDVLRIKEGKVTDNWHLEDNLTLLQQLGAINTNG